MHAKTPPSSSKTAAPDSYRIGEPPLDPLGAKLEHVTTKMYADCKVASWQETIVYADGG